MKPWFVPESVPYLESLIQSNWNCFEWGSGQSTLWLAELTNTVISIEHDPYWFDRNDAELKPYKNTSLYYQLLTENYANYIFKYSDNYFDLVEVDGRNRAACIINAIPKLKTGGILIVDNTERDRYQKSLALLHDWICRNFVGKDNWTTSVFIKP